MDATWLHSGIGMSDAMNWAGEAGESWADEYRRTDRSFGGLTDRLLARTREFRFESVLDIGCGAGELSLAIARGRNRTTVVGVDISPALIEAARKRGERLTNVSFELGDAAEWAPPEDFLPELLVSRHGVMFFDDPPAAFAHLASISAPEANLLFSCFRAPKDNEIFTAIAGLLPPLDNPPDPKAPGPMAFADPEHVRGILSQAGWKDVEFEPFDFAMVVGAGEDPVADAVEYFLSIGPASVRVKSMETADRRAFLAKLREFVESRRVDNIVALGAGAWLVNAKLA